MPFLHRRYPFVLLATAALCLTPARAAEPAATPNHAELLRRMPVALLAYSGAVPDAKGLIGYNRDGFKAAAFQRGATVKLALAAARGDEKQADDCWRAVDAAFAHQMEEGHFGDPPTSVAFWLCELGRTLLVIQQSPLAGHFQDRITALKPKIARAAQWLAGQHAVLQREDRAAPNRLFFDAEAFFFTAQLLGDTALEKLGHEFIDQGMQLYRPEDGVFLEHNGADSSYQAVNLLRLQEIVLHFPDRKIEDAVARGVQWEIARIGPDGAVSTDGNTRVYAGGEKFMGHEKQVNIGEISLALLYYHERTGDPAALAAVERLHRYAAAQKR
ncbi:MAG: hypothetical protein P4L99_18920 [Chthoniobacter sp.]|nr:hypothetical protein [Chthoniobacter sp.]